MECTICGKMRGKNFSSGTGVRDPKLSNNRHVLESYSQDDVTVLWQDCRVFRLEFMQTGNIDVFVESITIASACNKMLRKRFLKPDTIGLIPT